MEAKNTTPAAPQSGAPAQGGFRGGPRQGGQRDNRGPRRGPRQDADREFDQRTLSLDRVTRVTKGGKRMRFRATIIIGDHKGRVGYGVAKAADVSQAINKAVTQAKKRVMTVPMVNETIPHMVTMKYGSASVLMKPAPKGTGVKAGGAMRVVLELAGVPNIVGKLLGGDNKLNNAKATIDALKLLRLKAA